MLNKITKKSADEQDTQDSQKAGGLTGAGDDRIAPNAYRRIFGYLLPFSSYFFIAFIGHALFAISQPGFAILMEGFVRALDGEFVTGLYLIPLACILIALMRGIGSYMGGYYMSKASANVIHNIRCELFSNIVALPTRFFDANKSGRLVSLFTYNTNLMTTASTQALTTIVREGLTVVALFTYLFYQNAQLTLVFFLLGPPLALAISWVGKKIKLYGSGIQSSVGELNHVSAEIFGGIRLVKSSAGEKKANQRFKKVSSATKKITLKMSKVSSIYTPMMQMMIVMAMALVMYLVLLSRGTMDAAELIAYVTAAGLLPKPIRSLSSVHPQLLQAVVAAEEVFKHIDYDKEIDTGKIDDASIKGSLSFSDVSFSYQASSQTVLDGVTFDVLAGQTLAVVGRSGGGKSTLVNLIPRFYAANKGTICLDSIPIDQYKLGFLRKNIAIVSQNVVLFNDTILANIAYGVEDASIADIEAAAIAANADEFIRGLSNGYETLVGENGTMLSGGQRQRLAIARAILRDAKVLILDEATSALDNESEVKVQDALEKVMQGRTTIVIAHRISTVEHADNIIVLDEGRIVEQGAHADLMFNNGLYAKMVQRDFSE
ncbi:MAG: lipid A export permease/ATP-binding protein MsbA [Pseudomonadales bacterium]|nr:lipid A export permease/ATP-binding protein MsbA [Pseudomonadales bacterium]